MLTAKDSSDWTLISHGIMSGSPQLFERAFAAVRDDVLDEEVSASYRNTCSAVLVAVCFEALLLLCSTLGRTGQS